MLAVHEIVVMNSENFGSVSVSFSLMRDIVIYSTYVHLLTHLLNSVVRFIVYCPRIKLLTTSDVHVRA